MPSLPVHPFVTSSRPTRRPHPILAAARWRLHPVFAAARWRLPPVFAAARWRLHPVSAAARWRLHPVSAAARWQLHPFLAAARRRPVLDSRFPPTSPRNGSRTATSKIVPSPLASCPESAIHFGISAQRVVRQTKVRSAPNFNRQRRNSSSSCKSSIKRLRPLHHFQVNNITLTIQQ